MKGILSPISFQKYEENGKPSVMVYNAELDVTSVIDQESPYYLHAVTALIVLEKCFESNPELIEKKSSIIEVPKPKLVIDNGIA